MPVDYATFAPPLCVIHARPSGALGARLANCTDSLGAEMDNLFWGLFADILAREEPDIEQSGRPSELVLATFHDVLSAQTKDDLPYLSDLADHLTGPILEVGCGSGRVLVPLIERGHEVVGVDRSEDILYLLRCRLGSLPAETQKRATLVRADATLCALERLFQLVILPFFTLALVDGMQERLALLRNVVRHLAPNGIFVFDYPTYRPMHSGMGMVASRDLFLEGRAVTVTMGWKLSEDSKRLIVNSFWKVPRSDGLTRHYLEAIPIVLVDHKEVENMLADVGFVIVERRRSVEGDPEKHLLLCKRRTDVTYPLWHPYLPLNGMEGRVTILVEGKGCTVRDTGGKEYIDASGGLWNTHCGLGNSEINQAIMDQLQRLPYGTLFAWRGNEPALQLARELIALAPSPLQWVYLTGSGSESVELAVKIARLYNPLRGRTNDKEIVYLDESYHGTFFGSLSVSGLDQPKQIGPLLPGVSSISTPNIDRCPKGVSYVDFALSCAKELEDRAIKGGVAAFIIEPILGSAGVIIPPIEYFRRVEEVCRKFNILLILDEVATGFGRTGRWFAAEHYDLRPDMLLLSKGINSGYVPLGAVLFSAEIGELLLKHGAGLCHGSTSNGHPVACAAALANIRVIRCNRLVEQAAEYGQYFRARLEELLALPKVKSIRSLGLMLAVVLGQEDGTPATPLQVFKVFWALKEAGVLASVGGGGTLIFCPALIITHDEIEMIVRQLHKTLSSLVLRNGIVEPS
jgi:adenosylmethionine-8-amino-7-oxononanoate aminotransferase/SAM-dependent methyltransferase